MEYLVLAIIAVVVIAIFLRKRSEDSDISVPPLQKASRSRPFRPLDGPAYVETDEDRERRRILNQECRSPAQFSSAIARRTDKSAALPEVFVVVDLETTGLSAKLDEIIEIGAIRVQRDAETHKTFQILVKPERPIPRRITELTGITQAMVDVAGAPLHIALAEFINFLGDLPMVAYNAPFDMGFLAAASRKCGLKIKNKHMCALKAARRAWPDLPSHKLSELAVLANLPMNDLHRSLGDCLRTAHIYVAAVSKIGSA
jgi:DNA polymerase III subunit epsilon